MCKKLICAILLALVLGPAWSAQAALDPALVGWWTLDEGAGTTALDSSGNGNDGSLNGNPQWVTGQLKGALEFDGSGDFIDCGNDSSLAFGDAVTMAAWIKLAAVGADYKIAGNENDADGGYKISIYSDSKLEFEIRTSGNDAVLNRDIAGGTEFAANTWYHVAGVYSRADGYIRTYVNGVLDRDMATTQALGVSPGNFYIGCEPYNTGEHNFNGTLDDVQLYNRALSAAEVLAVMPGLSVEPMAGNPSPGDQATDVPRYAILSWTPGESILAHDVYLATDVNQVNAASRDNPLDVLVSRNQDANAYQPPNVLAFGETYYWRVDEVSGIASNTIHQGSVWSFTVEPRVYRIEDIVATASIPAFADNQGPEKTVDGSGLSPDGQHSNLEADMWLGNGAAGGPVWIQYDFGKVYKLEGMQVWNYNHAFEFALGYSVRNVTVEYSTDGSEWAALGDYEWSRGPSAAAYASDITVDFQGLPVRHVRLNIHDNWGTGTSYGLSEVRFFYTPVYAREIEPAEDERDVNLDVALTWRSGREAVTHEVYFSEDAEAVESGTALAEVLDKTVYRPEVLELGKRYYWRIIEVNEAATPTFWASDVLDFYTKEYAAVDDFESYTDEGNEIFYTWADGYNVAGNGSQVGYDDPPYAEQDLVHGGDQSMPITYENIGSEPHSTAERVFASPQDWTAAGADMLRLYYRGYPIGFVPVSDSEIIMNGMGNDIWDIADQFRYVYKPLSGNGSIVAKVESVDNTSDWAKFGVMIRETLQDGSAHAIVAVTPRQGVALQYRATTNETSTNVQQTHLAAPYWVKLTRSGNRFTAERSADGVTWVSITDDPAASTVEIPMDTSVYVGLAACSHSTTTAAGVRFSNIATTGSVTGAWQSVPVGLEQPVGNVPDTLSLTVTDSAGHARTVVHPDPYAVGLASWTAWRIPFEVLTSAGVDVTSVAKLALTIGEPDAAASGATGLILVDDVEIGRPMVHTATADVTTADDTVQGVPHDVDWPTGEVPELALDNSVTTKFLHFKGETEPTGLRVTPVLGASIVTGLTLRTANDASERDPIAFELYGSNESLDGPYTLIASGEIVDFAQEAVWPRFTINETPIVFENTTAYAHYQLLFPAVRDPEAANSMQIGEVELIGDLVP